MTYVQNKSSGLIYIHDDRIILRDYCNYFNVLICLNLVFAIVDFSTKWD